MLTLQHECEGTCIFGWQTSRYIEQDEGKVKCQQPTRQNIERPKFWTKNIF